MYEVICQQRFNATHAVRIEGQREPIHGHDWIVRVIVAGPTLDDQGLLCDFHDLERTLAGLLAPWNHRCLNELDPFGASLEPTAENLARVLADRLGQALNDRLPSGARVARVEVTEAPNCVAAYAPPPQRPGLSEHDQHQARTP
ncbi:MAG: 6-carboxy-5,6,7,8-tetrahydropterin synthase [Phycisphaerales bacterium]|nr:MAG: 6-carboxy-5,6,7,8-tetrahydropterin synthase [Phycisphaerales bacterium]